MELLHFIYFYVEGLYVLYNKNTNLTFKEESKSNRQSSPYSASLVEGYSACRNVKSIWLQMLSKTSSSVPTPETT